MGKGESVDVEKSKTGSPRPRSTVARVPVSRANFGERCAVRTQLPRLPERIQKRWRLLRPRFHQMRVHAFDEKVQLSTAPCTWSVEMVGKSAMHQRMRSRGRKAQLRR